jgi:hypothetical protein
MPSGPGVAPVSKYSPHHLAVVVVALDEKVPGAGHVEARDLAPPALHEPVRRAGQKAVGAGHGVAVEAGGLAAVVDREVGPEEGGIGEAGDGAERGGTGDGVQRRVAALAVDEAAGGVGWRPSGAPRPQLGVVAAHGAEP